MRKIFVFLTSLFVSANAFAIDNEIEGDQQDHNYLIRTSLLSPIGGSYIVGIDRVLDELTTFGVTLGIHPKYDGTTLGMDVKHYIDGYSNQSSFYFSYNTGLISASFAGEDKDTHFVAKGYGHYLGASVGTKYTWDSGLALLVGAGFDYVSMEMKVDAENRGVGFAQASGFTPTVDLTWAYQL